MRFIPATMATQHPDNAGAPFFKNDPFISTHDEIEESYLMYSEMNFQEYMWDWEGKFVDEAVIDKLFRQYYDFFQAHKLGQEMFLTFRVPNIWEEKGHRLARAYMSILTAEEMAKEYGFHTPPIFEVILPMTSAASQLIYMQKTFNETARYKNKIFKATESEFEHINIIPLFESVENLLDVESVLDEYLHLYKTTFKTQPLEYLRPFIARSDPALNAGLIPAVLSCKASLSLFYTWGKGKKLPVYPIIGPGSLPFRGHLNPRNIDNFIKEYPGVRTVTVQSAFRYDYPLDEVKEAVTTLNKVLPLMDPIQLRPKEITQIKQVNDIFCKLYRETVEQIAPEINAISECVPARRERILHVGLFGYSRGVGKVKLPRAIKFTAALYSLGIPPELIATGRGLKEAKKNKLLPVIEKLYVNLRHDLIQAGKYLNKENIAYLCEKDPKWRPIMEDVEAVEEYLGQKLEAQRVYHKIHRNLVSSIMLQMDVGDPFDEELLKAAQIRKSLG
jgi:phosphoenolpyruvate carboxylase